MREHFTSRRSRLVLLGLGSNLGDRERTLRRAVVTLARFGAARVALLYRSPAVGDPGGAEFLNTALALDTALAADALLAVGKRLELLAGRRRARRWAARALDVDVLYDAAGESSRPELRLPHPHLRERGFVLAPLARLVPDLPLPPDGATPAALLAELARRTPAQLPEEMPWTDPPLS